MSFARTSFTSACVGVLYFRFSGMDLPSIIGLLSMNLLNNLLIVRKSELDLVNL